MFVMFCSIWRVFWLCFAGPLSVMKVRDCQKKLCIQSSQDNLCINTQASLHSLPSPEVHYFPSAEVCQGPICRTYQRVQNSSQEEMPAWTIAKMCPNHEERVQAGTKESLLHSPENFLHKRNRDYWCWSCNYWHCWTSCTNWIILTLSICYNRIYYAIISGFE